MTAREYAKKCGIEIVGKLTRKTSTTSEWDWNKCELVEKKSIYYIDEAGTVIQGDKSGWCLITADDDIY